MSTTTKRTLSNIILLLLSLGIVLLGLASCGSGGGGGGGDEQVEPAVVSLEANPTSLDSGDRVSVKVNLSEIHQDGVLIKIQFPTEMHYVRSTSFLRIDGNEVDVDPAIEITTGKENAEQSYIVYDFSSDTFDGERKATLMLKLEGDSEVKKGGTIAVDADFNDPVLSFDEKFNGLAPEFDPTDTVKIEVRDSSGSVTPTPTPTITPTRTPTTKPTKSTT